LCILHKRGFIRNFPASLATGSWSRHATSWNLMPNPPAALHGYRTSSDAPSVLIVDDEVGMTQVVSDLLSRHGYLVSVASNGRLALAQLREQPVDVVLTDVMMPVMDGPELLQEMLADERYCKIPVIFMTSLPESVPAEASADHAVLEKPFSSELLLKVIEDTVGP
jgi:CheY-like chemotaxis protein